MHKKIYTELLFHYVKFAAINLVEKGTQSGAHSTRH